MLNSSRLQQLFSVKSEQVLAVYFTAGFPSLGDTTTICLALQSAGVDLIEIGMPFSDPLADGPTIQASNQVALANGMSLKLLFEQLERLRSNLTVPLVLMGYLNPVIQFGMERFLSQSAKVGVDGVILPDLPIDEYEREFKDSFELNNIAPIFLVSPNTSKQRLRLIDSYSKGFIYAVSSAAVTGGTIALDQERREYFQSLRDAKLVNPVLIGFGISDSASFRTACHYANGAIIGSAFIEALGKGGDLAGKVESFVRTIRNG